MEKWATDVFFRRKQLTPISDALGGIQTGMNMRSMIDKQKTDRINNQMLKDKMRAQKLNKVFNSMKSSEGSYQQGLKDLNVMGYKSNLPNSLDRDKLDEKIFGNLSFQEQLGFQDRQLNQAATLKKSGLMMGQGGKIVDDPNYQDPRLLDATLKKAQLAKIINEPGYAEKSNINTEAKNRLFNIKNDAKKEADAIKAKAAKEKGVLDYNKAMELKGFKRKGKNADGSINWVMPKGNKKKKKTSAELKQLRLFKQGLVAERQFLAAYKSGLDSGGYNPASSVELLDNSGAPQWMKNRYANDQRAAREAWVESYLRDASGAAIPNDERYNYSRQFFPEPGDSKQAIINKRALRRQKMVGSFESSGSDPGDAELIIDGKLEIKGLVGYNKDQGISPSKKAALNWLKRNKGHKNYNAVKRKAEGIE